MVISDPSRSMANSAATNGLVMVTLPQSPRGSIDPYGEYVSESTDHVAVMCHVARRAAVKMLVDSVRIDPSTDN